MRVKFLVFLSVITSAWSQATFPDATTTTTTVTVTTILDLITSPPPSVNVTICVPRGQCEKSGGFPVNEGTDGKMDVRINNSGMKYNTTVGSATQITTVAGTGVPLVVSSQTSCPAYAELCNFPDGYKCGLKFDPIPGSPTGNMTATYGAYPSSGLVMRNDPMDMYTYYGSGALIDHMHFLTVANKVLQFIGRESEIKVRLGDWNLASTAEPVPHQEFMVSDVFVHPDFNEKTLVNNIAILKLTSPVQLGTLPTIGTACLPADDLSNSNIYCMVAGYGKFAKNADANFVLKDVDQPILNATFCEGSLKKSVLGAGFKLDPSWMCAGGEVGKSTCDGDGGNPLLCNITGQFYVVGLASWAPIDQNCGANPFPELYVNIAKYVSWIQAVTANFAGTRRKTTPRFGSAGNTTTAGTTPAATAPSTPAAPTTTSTSSTRPPTTTTTRPTTTKKLLVKTTSKGATTRRTTTTRRNTVNSNLVKNSIAPVGK